MNNGLEKNASSSVLTQNSKCSHNGRNNEGFVRSCSDLSILPQNGAQSVQPKNRIVPALNTPVSNDIVLADDGTLEQTNVSKIPEGGWGWFIVLSSLLIHLIIGGLDRSSGILYLKFEEKFNQPAVVTAWIPSICTGFRLCLGPVVGILCNTYSFRLVVTVGAIFVVVSAILSGYSTSIYTLFFTYGVLGGIGHAMTYTPAVVAISEYFKKKNGTAVGIGTSGVGIGMFVVPLLLEASFDFYGFSGAFYVIAALALELFVCGALLRPAVTHRKILGLDKRPTTFSLYSIDQPDSVHDTERKLTSTQSDFSITVLPNYPIQQQSRKSSVVAVFRRFSTAFGIKSKKDTKSTKLFDLSLMRNERFTAFNIGIMVFTLAFQSGMVFFPPYALQIGATEYEAAYTITIIGLADFVGRIFVGILFDRKTIAPLRVHIYTGLMISLGVLFIGTPNVTTYAQLCVICVIFGILTGMFISQKSVIIIDFVGVEHLPQAFGILLFFQGLGVFIGPPLAGFLKDVNGTYDYGFYVGGVGVLVGSLILIVTNVVYGIQSSKRIVTKL